MVIILRKWDSCATEKLNKEIKTLNIVRGDIMVQIQHLSFRICLSRPSARGTQGHDNTIKLLIGRMKNTRD